MTTITETTETILKPKILVEIAYDPDIQDPSENDCSWTLISFNDRHTAYQSPDKYFTRQYDDKYHVIGIKANEVGLLRKLTVGTAFILSYHEHGDCIWSIQGTGPQDPWDTTEVGGLLLWDYNPRDLGAKTYKDRAKDAAGFLEDYTDWSNGHGLRYSVQFVEAKDVLDEEGEEIEAKDLEGTSEYSQWGYYNNNRDGMLSDVRIAISDILEDKGLGLDDVTIAIWGDAGDYISPDEVTPNPKESPSQKATS